MLGELKGIGKIVLSCRTSAHRFELLTYADESWAVRRDGYVIDSWEAAEQDCCLRTFGRLIGLQDHPENLVILLVRPSHRLTSDSPSASYN